MPGDLQWGSQQAQSDEIVKENVNRTFFWDLLPFALWITLQGDCLHVHDEYDLIS